MWVILVCAALVLAGLAAVVGWGSLPVEPPPAPARPAADPTEPPPASLVVRRYLWYLAVAVASGAAAGILAAGAGGRLVMRLLAVTAGADAQGRITEAEEIVGRITVDGTIALVVFHGMLVAALAGRLSRAVPLLSARPGAIAIYVPLLLLVLPGAAVALVLVIVGVVVVLVSRIPSMVAVWRSRPVVPVGRVALAVAAVVAFPGFALAGVDIVGRP